jgi:glycerol uptake facilitator-like aquaporin
LLCVIVRLECLDGVLLNESAFWRKLVAEYLGGLLLAAIVIGSGIAAQTFSPHAIGLELLENAAATGLGLFVLITTLGPISGAHFNPVISFVDAAFGGISWRTAWSYLVAQVVGCTTGAILANLMFSKSAISLSTHHRATLAHGLAEVMATAGLVLVIFALAKANRSSTAPAAVGAYIASAYFFTSSTSFANPAIVVGRMLSNSFAGIAPSSAPLFVVAEVIGGIVGFGLVKSLYPGLTARDASRVIDSLATGDAY